MTYIKEMHSGHGAYAGAAAAKAQASRFSHHSSTPEGVARTDVPRPLYEAAKRTMDLVFASVLLVLTAPIVLLAALAILISTRRSAVLVQRRVGRFGREFAMLKLRTMRGEEQHDAVPTGLLAPKPADDPRVTGIGRVLRRTSIDELPQLLNVLAGQMSLVGPRPALPAEVEGYLPSWRRRLAVKPGLSGLWQVSGRSSVPVRRWMAMDRLYIQRRTLLLDCRILLATVAAVVSMRGAW